MGRGRRGTRGWPALRHLLLQPRERPFTRWLIRSRPNCDSHCLFYQTTQGFPGASCNVNYWLRRVDFSQVPSGRTLVQFGVSGGNPIVPIFTTFDDSLNASGYRSGSSGSGAGGARTLVSGRLSGWTDIEGCVPAKEFYGADVYAGGTLCDDRVAVRRLSIYSPIDQGDVSSFIDSLVH